jgi:hypothetical protein
MAHFQRRDMPFRYYLMRFPSLEYQASELDPLLDFRLLDF